jgi:hypothetical protein
MKNTVESHSSRLEKVEDRLSGLEDKVDIIEKTRQIHREKNKEI